MYDFAIAAADLPVGRVDVGRPGRVVHADLRHLDALQHVDRLVAGDLELGERLVEHDAGLRVVERERVGRFRDADELGREEHRGVVEDALPQLRLIAGRTDRLAAGAVELEAGELAA